MYYWYFITWYLFRYWSFHFVLSLGAVYTIFAGFYTYFNYFSSYFYINEFLSILHFNIFFLSSNLIFLSMHSLGLMGLPRRVFDYHIIYFRFHWFQSFAWIGILLSIFLFISSLLLSYLAALVPIVQLFLFFIFGCPVFKPFLYLIFYIRLRRF